MQYVSNNKDLSQVEELDLSDRQIIRASPNILNLTENLRSLDLSRNKLSEEWEQKLFSLPLLKKITVDSGLED